MIHNCLLCVKFNLNFHRCYINEIYPLDDDCTLNWKNKNEMEK